MEEISGLNMEQGLNKASMERDMERGGACGCGLDNGMEKPLVPIDHVIMVQTCSDEGA